MGILSKLTSLFTRPPRVVGGDTLEIKLSGEKPTISLPSGKQATPDDFVRFGRNNFAREERELAALAKHKGLSWKTGITDQFMLETLSKELGLTAFYIDSGNHTYLVLNVNQDGSAETYDAINGESTMPARTFKVAVDAATYAFTGKSGFPEYEDTKKVINWLKKNYSLPEIGLQSIGATEADVGCGYIAVFAATLCNLADKKLKSRVNLQPLEKLVSEKP